MNQTKNIFAICYNTNITRLSNKTGFANLKFATNLTSLILKLILSVKKSGNIGKIIRFVDWQKITPLGAAGFVYKQEINKCSTKNFNADMLHNKEVFLNLFVYLFF